MKKKYLLRLVPDGKPQATLSTKRKRSLMLAAFLGVLILVYMVVFSKILTPISILAFVFSFILVLVSAIYVPRLMSPSYSITDSSVVLDRSTALTYPEIISLEIVDATKAKAILLQAPNLNPDDMPAYGYVTNHVLTLNSSKIEDVQLIGSFVHLRANRGGKIYDFLLAPYEKEEFVTDLKSKIGLK